MGWPAPGVATVTFKGVTFEVTAANYARSPVYVHFATQASPSEIIIPCSSASIPFSAQRFLNSRPKHAAALQKYGNESRVSTIGLGRTVRRLLRPSW